MFQAQECLVEVMHVSLFMLNYIYTESNMCVYIYTYIMCVYMCVCIYVYISIYLSI